MQEEKKADAECVHEIKHPGQTHEEYLKHKTMRISIKEGSASSVMSGVTDSYIAPFALAMNANNAQIGFLSSIPSLLSPLTQIFSSRLMEKYSRKKIIVISVAMTALMWLPMLVLALFFWKDLFTEHLVNVLIILYSLYAIFGAIAGPAWFSLLGDIVPDKMRGRYFAKRNKICGTVALVSSLIAAFFLDYFKTKGFLLLGFSILFLIGCVARLVSAYLFSKHYDPKLELKKDYYFSLLDFIKKAPTNNFGKFVFYVALIHLATNIAGPFFAVYMLKELNMTYTTFMLVNLSASVFSLLSMSLWGKFSDKYGNKQLLRIGSLAIPLMPILWIFSGSSWYIALVPQFVGGVFWAAFNLAVSNFIYDSVTPQRRGLCVAYHNVIAGVGVFVGATLGGFIMQYIPIGFMNKFFFIFLISGLARALVVFIMLPKFKEVREVKPMNSKFFFHIKELKPMFGMVYGIMHLHKFRKTTETIEKVE